MILFLLEGRHIMSSFYPRQKIWGPTCDLGSPRVSLSPTRVALPYFSPPIPPRPLDTVKFRSTSLTHGFSLSSPSSFSFFWVSPQFSTTVKPLFPWDDINILSRRHGQAKPCRAVPGGSRSRPPVFCTFWVAEHVIKFLLLMTTWS